MDPLKTQALLNAALVVEKLEPGQTITREDLIERLRKPLPAIRDCPSDAVILHAYRHYVINAGVSNVHRIVTYEEAATLANKSVEGHQTGGLPGNNHEVDRVLERKGAHWCLPKEPFGLVQVDVSRISGGRLSAQIDA